jgi:hypothetical protein
MRVPNLAFELGLILFILLDGQFLIAVGIRRCSIYVNFDAVVAT